MAEETTTTEEVTEVEVEEQAAPVEKLAPTKKLKKDEYVYAVGRRKCAVAQTRLWLDGKGEITVNDKPMREFFVVEDYRQQVMEPLVATGHADAVRIAIKVAGGGSRGQAEAARLGISRALLILNPDYRKTLKPLGFLTRDSRKKERKKPGLKKARKAPQWSKR